MKVYNVLKGSMECEIKDRWMRMESWDQRLIWLVSERYHSVVRGLRLEENGCSTIYVFLLVPR